MATKHIIPHQMDIDTWQIVLNNTFADKRVDIEFSDSVGLTPSFIVFEDGLTTEESLIYDALVIDNTIRNLTQSDIRQYLKTQLISIAPDVPTIYTQVKAYVDSNIQLQQAVTNTINLYVLADGVSIDELTDSGKAKYLRAVLHILALIT
jgi:hypothetical protein